MSNYKTTFKAVFRKGTKILPSLNPRLTLPSDLMVSDTDLLEKGCATKDGKEFDYVVVKFYISKVIS